MASSGRPRSFRVVGHLILAASIARAHWRGSWPGLPSPGEHCQHRSEVACLVPQTQATIGVDRTWIAAAGRGSRLVAS